MFWAGGLEELFELELEPELDPDPEDCVGASWVVACCGLVWAGAGGGVGACSWVSGGVIIGSGVGIGSGCWSASWVICWSNSV